MNNVLKAVKMTDDVWWVGAVDWDICDFCGYSTGCGAKESFILKSKKRPALSRSGCKLSVITRFYSLPSS